MQFFAPGFLSLYHRPWLRNIWWLEVEWHEMQDITMLMTQKHVISRIYQMNGAGLNGAIDDRMLMESFLMNFPAPIPAKDDQFIRIQDAFKRRTI